MVKNINWDLYDYDTCRKCNSEIIRRNGETFLCDSCREKEIINYYM